ncbi:hypothetical protein HX747_19950 [Streptomyces sp. L06]|nr:hypothetical protein [Streptomyces sp. L06]
MAQLAREDRWFVGRGEQLAALGCLVDAGRATDESTLLLLTGAPGSARPPSPPASPTSRPSTTRRPDPHRPGGVLPRPAPYSAYSALRRLTSALGEERPLADLDLEAAFRSRAAGKRLLIVLDNAASAEQVRPLLPGTSSSLVVVTSRRGLPGLIAREGARPLRVEGLGEQDALRLFSGIVGESFVATHRSLVEAVIAACEGVPLALRIAATQVKVAAFPRPRCAASAPRTSPPCSACPATSTPRSPPSSTGRTTGCPRRARGCTGRSARTRHRRSPWGAPSSSAACPPNPAGRPPRC